MTQVILRTVFFYFFVLLSYRIMGKREVGQLGIVDLIVSILIAELIAISIENKHDSIFLTVIPIIILVLLEVVIAYISIKSRKIRTILEGKPSIIIYKGKINYPEMIKQRYNLDNLLFSLRQKGIKSIKEVEYAFLESNGKLSIFKYKFNILSSSYPMPLIVDGSPQANALKYINKDINWLEEKVREKNINIKDIFYCFYKNKKLYIIKKSEVKTNNL